MSQKVLQVGTSAAITIPKDFLTALQLKVGDQVTVKRDEKRGGIIVLPVRKVKDEKEFVVWTKEFLSEYGPALKALAKK
ncbi:MAG: AbrB/MazE/SpoVT family DNA-binding domain-containing protein [Patescibacteria group bacterium]